MAKQPDYLAELGKGPRIACAVILTPFAVFFLLCGLGSFVAMISMSVNGDWVTAPIVLVSGLFCGFLGAVLLWLARRLFRGTRSGNRITVMPAWFIQTMGVLLFPGCAYTAYLAMFQGRMGIPGACSLSGLRSP